MLRSNAGNNRPQRTGLGFRGSKLPARRGSILLLPVLAVAMLCQGADSGIIENRHSPYAKLHSVDLAAVRW